MSRPVRTSVVLFAKRLPDNQDLLSSGTHPTSFYIVRNSAALFDVISHADCLLCWDADLDSIAAALPLADRLKWLQWPFVGVDGILPALEDRPDIVLTNASGVFDAAIAEYVLGLVLAMAKDLPTTFAMQMKRIWAFRETQTIAGKNAVVVGVGGVGRAIGKLLRAVGMNVKGVGRTRRPGDDAFTEINAVRDFPGCLANADFVIAAAPLTSSTRLMFSAQALACMRETARFINVGRGELVDEGALLTALENGRLAGAALDVFQSEPLPPTSSLWSNSRVIVSPHMAGDVADTFQRLTDLFQDNLARFLAGSPLRNTIDRELGFLRR